MDTKLVIAVSWWAQRLQKGDKVAFAKSLLESITASKPKRLFVDYDPENELLAAVRAAGVECRGVLFSADGILPQKTGMWIMADKIEVREGYRAPIETIWDASWFDEAKSTA